MRKYEINLWQQGYEKILGMDEAGRGPLAGPVCIAGVIFAPHGKIPEGINDSKKLSEAERESLFDAITSSAIFSKIVFVSEKRIDRINILEAVKEGMRSIAKAAEAHFILTDAVNFSFPDIPQLALIKGDTLSISIAAASILAKVSRDRYMKKMAQKYPEYGFEVHKGYPTKAHTKAVHTFGQCPIHRKSFTVPSL